MKSPKIVYDIYLVENGKLRDFERGLVGGCQIWGHDMDLDEVRQRYRDLADENFRRDGGEYDRIREDGGDDPEIACSRYLDELTEGDDPTEWRSIEWNDDLQWVRVRARREIVTTRPVYVMRDGDCAKSNPYRLTPYVTLDGEIWLHAEGNGCGTDKVIPDIEGMTRSEAWEAIAKYDVAAMRADADMIADAGDADNADWLRGWCDLADDIQRGREVDAETRENAIRELRDNGYGEDADEIDDIREVWSDDSATIYRANGSIYFMLSAGAPTFFDGVSDAHAAAAF